MSYIHIATAQVPQKHINKIKNEAKKLKPKYIFDYNYESDMNIKTGLEKMHNFVKNAEDNIQN